MRRGLRLRRGGTGTAAAATAAGYGQGSEGDRRRAQQGKAFPGNHCAPNASGSSPFRVLGAVVFVVGCPATLLRGIGAAAAPPDYSRRRSRNSRPEADDKEDAMED